MAKPPKPPAATEAPDLADLPDVERHDEIYFRHEAGGHAKLGKVLARGAHGCSVEAGGQKHKVRWEHYLGHATRVRPDVKVVHQGEDGMLVEAPDGSRRFVRDPLGVVDQRPDESPTAKPKLAKSYAPLVLLFTDTPEALLKAAGAGKPRKNGAGLHMEKRTDRSGKMVSRWVRNGEAAAQKPAIGKHNVKEGHHVRFRSERGDHEGHVASEPGDHGAHVRDASGQTHKVLYTEMSHHDPDKKPPAGGGGDDGGDGKDKTPKPFFDEAEVAKLPDAKDVVQPVKSWAQLKKKGAEGQAQFETALQGIAKTLGLRTDVAAPEDFSEEHLKTKDGYLLIAPMKSEKRAKEKVETDYHDDWSLLKDVIRATIAVDSMDDVHKAIAAVKAAGLELAQKPKDKFAKPTPEGYRDLNTIVRLPNGMLAELQYHLKPITVAKNTGHKDYEEMRDLLVKYKTDEEPTERWSPEDHAAFYDSRKRQQKIYNAAWESRSGP